MKGLELAEKYYLAHGAPMIAAGFGDYTRRIAAGLAGPGSECFGFDDAVSRDHDWGPGFCLWLTREDYASIGQSLQEAYQKLPRTFMGYGPRRVSPGEEARTGVRVIADFYSTYTGLDHAPATLAEWMAIPEGNLAVCTNGKVFCDPLGRFSRWRSALNEFYPEDVRLKKIASRCLSAAQAGQYNFERSLRRGERFAAQYALIQFCNEAMALAFLLNRRYAPFYKWMHRAVGDLPILGKEIHGMVHALTLPGDDRNRVALIEGICAKLIAELQRQGLSDVKSDFLLDHAAPVHGRIQDPALGRRLTVV